MKSFRLLKIGSCVLAAIYLQIEVCAQGKLSFNHDVRPILSAHCFECHGPDAKARKAKLRLDQAASATASRDGAIAVVPGKPEDSELLDRVLSDDPDEVMPPPELKRVLTAEQKKTLRRWIAEGAEFEEHWAYQKPNRPTPPQTKNAPWGNNEIDAFIFARLGKAGLEPSREADNYSLVRRLYLDLTGLPPSPEEADAFAKDEDPEAYEKQGTVPVGRLGHHVELRDVLGRGADHEAAADRAGAARDDARRPQRNVQGKEFLPEIVTLIHDCKRSIIRNSVDELLHSLSVFLAHSTNALIVRVQRHDRLDVVRRTIQELRVTCSTLNNLELLYAMGR